MRKTGRLAIAVLGALVLCLALGVGSAQAKQVYEYVYSGEYLDGSGSEKGVFNSKLAGVAYDSAREKLLVLVGSEPTYFTKFTKAGVPDPFSAPSLGDSVMTPTSIAPPATIAVDNSGTASDGNIYVGGGNEEPPLYPFEADGLLSPGKFGYEGLRPCGVAVDPQGNVWIATAQNTVALQEFTAAGVSTGVEINPGFTACKPAIDSEGNFYVVNQKSGAAFKLGPSGEVLYELTEHAEAFAVDSSNDDVFALEPVQGHYPQRVVSQYDSSGVKLNTFGIAPPASAYNQLAVDESSGAVLAANPGGGTAQSFEAPSYAPGEALETAEKRGLASSVAVNQASGERYLASAGQQESEYGKAGSLQRFDSAGSELSCPNSLAHPAGLAVDPVNENLDVVDVDPEGGAQLRVLPRACGSQLSSFPVDYAAGGPLPQPATDSAGNVYYPNAVKDRLEELDQAGTLKRAFGWDVVESGPDDSSGTEEVQSVKVKSGSGTFDLSLAGRSTAVSGSGNISSGSTTVSNVKLGGVNVVNAAFVAGEVISGTGIPAGTTIAAVGSETLTLSQAATETTIGASFSASLPHDASAATVQAALNSLKAIAGAGGSLTVSGGPGDASGSSPYEVHFGGGLRGTDVKQLAIASAKLGLPNGTQVECAPFLGSSGGEVETTSYQWLRGGAPIAGATSPTYTTTAADEGQAIQCQVSVFNADSGVTKASSPFVADPYPSSALRANFYVHVEGAGNLQVGGAGGQTLKCGIGNPVGATFAYRWYRNGAAIAGATAQQYVLTEADLATPASFQCAATATNAAGSVTEVSSESDTSPAPGNPEPPALYGANTSALNASSVSTTTKGSSYEICEPAAGDTCKAGVPFSGDNSSVDEAGVGQLTNPNAVAIDATTGGFYAVDGTSSGEQASGGRAQRFAADGTPLGTFAAPGNVTAVAVDGQSGDVFLGRGFGPSFHVQRYDSGESQLNDFGLEEFGGFPGLRGPGGLAVDPASHEVWVTSPGAYAGGGRVEKFRRSPPTATVPTTTTGKASDITVGTATLNGTVNPDGIETTECRFEWGKTPAFGNSAPCAQGNSFAGSEDRQVSAQISGLVKGKTYYFRLFAENGNEKGSPAGTNKFIAQGKPLFSDVYADHVNTDGVRLNATVDPNGGSTRYRFEWGTDEGSYPSSSAQSEPFGLIEPRSFSQVVTGLQPGTTYHYRVVAENEAGESAGEDRAFATFSPEPGTDPCPNAQVRQQTGASPLLDCRAYELVSAANAGGYDVESDLVAGQTPFPGFPEAKGRLLYGLHYGAVPGVAGSPTNYGLDPYLATRTEHGWKTSYVGLPAGGMADGGTYGSPLLEADPSLTEFAFGGEGICSPCFEDGSTNIPVRRPDGSLVEGMAGSLGTAANPAGEVAKHVSADGSHLVFSTTTKLEPAGRNGLSTLYERNLRSGSTEVVSTLPNGSTMPGGAASELAVSAGGSRVLVATKVSSDAKGNPYYHLYMHLEGDPHSVDLTPGTTSGALFGGMSEDGSRVYFTTADRLLGEDTDESADVYEAEIDSTGALHLRLVTRTASGPSNDDSCEPPGTPTSWNAVEGDGRCNAVAFAGGAGLAPRSGDLYFLSPELLDGPSHGEAGQANLYRYSPGDAAPSFVTVMDSSAPKPAPSSTLSLVRGISPFSKPSAQQRLFVAVDNSGGPSDGDVYVADAKAEVVKKFDAEGNLISSWGAGGSLRGASTHVWEIRITAASGNWKISVGGQSTGPLPFDATPAELQGALETLPNVNPGDVSASGGPGNQQKEYPYYLSFAGQYAGGAPEVKVENVDLESQFGGTPSVVSSVKKGFGGGISGIAVDSSGNLDVLTARSLYSGGGPRPSLPGGAVDAIFGFAEDGSFQQATPLYSFDGVSQGGLAVGPSGQYLFYADGLAASEVRAVKVGSRETAAVAQVGDKTEVTGVATDPSTGDLYVSRANGKIELYSFNGSGEVLSGGSRTCKVFEGKGEGCFPTEVFASGFTGLHGLAIDPSSHDVYADLGNRVAVFDQQGQQLEPFGEGSLSGSTALAAASAGDVFATSVSGSVGTVEDFAPVSPPWTPVDDPAIVHAVQEPGTYRSSDFQVTPDGRFAAFASPLSLTGHTNRGHLDVFRYDAESAQLACGSCAPTGAAPASDASLAPHGRSLTDDGRLFFTSAEPYVLRDANERRDVYEWEDGRVALVSTGASHTDSSLLSVGSDGTDAFFFTRERLVHEDENGSAVKIYDAREGGGFFYEAPPLPCAASDECHGPGTQPAPTPAINTVTGAGQRSEPSAKARRCARGKVRRRGRCVARHHRRKHRHRRAHRRRKGARR